MKERLLKELAEYNTRISKGIMHRKEYVDWMKELQKEFEEFQLTHRG